MIKYFYWLYFEFLKKRLDGILGLYYCKISECTAVHFYTALKGNFVLATVLKKAIYYVYI